MSLVSLGLGLMKSRTGARKVWRLFTQREVSPLSGQASLTPAGWREAHPTLSLNLNTTWLPLMRIYRGRERETDGGV